MILVKSHIKYSIHREMIYQKRTSSRNLFHVIVLVIFVIIFVLVIHHIHISPSAECFALDKIPGGAGVLAGFRFNLNTRV